LTLAERVKLVRRVNKAIPDSRVKRETGVRWVLLGLRALREIKVPPASKEERVFEARRVLPEKLARQESRESRVLRADPETSVP